MRRFSSPRAYLLGILAAVAIPGIHLTMNTHSEALGEDMVAVSTLKDNEGREYPATAWQGSAPGGHHRKGVLEFQDLGENSASITLIIKGIANVPERIFEWPVER